MDAVQGLFTSVPLDYLFLGGFTVLVALDALRSGIGRAAALALAAPVAAFLFSYAREATAIGGMLSSPILEAGAFLALIVIAFFLIQRMGMEYIGSGGQPLQAALAGIAVTIIGTVAWMHIDALRTVWEFSTHVQALFAEQFRLFWLLGAYAALAFARG